MKIFRCNRYIILHFWKCEQISLKSSTCLYRRARSKGLWGFVLQKHVLSSSHTAAADSTHRAARAASGGRALLRPERGEGERGAGRCSGDSGTRELCVSRAGALHTVHRGPGACGQLAALSVGSSGPCAERPQHCRRQHGRRGASECTCHVLMVSTPPDRNHS